VRPGVPRRVPLPLGSRDGVDPKLVAAIDRLVHHATILEMSVESYRRKAALKRKHGKAD